MPSPRSFSNSSHCWLYLFALHSPGVSQQFLVVFLIVILCIWRPKKSFSSISCSILSKIHGSSYMSSPHNCFECGNSSHLSGTIRDSAKFDSPKAIILGLFILSFQLSFPKSYRYIIQIFSIKLVTYSSSCI